MKSFYLVPLFATLLSFAPARAETSIDVITRLSNLRVRHVIDTCCDYVAQDLWSFGKNLSGMDLMTWAMQSHDGQHLTTDQLADQLRRGRVRNLGPARTWTEMPTFPDVTLSDDPDGNWIILTDLEPDDRLALAYLSRTLPADRVLAVGANLLNAASKALQTRRWLDHLGWSKVPVLTGNGGEPASYPDFKSNAAARAYAGNAPPAGASLQLQAFIQDAMVRARRERKWLNFLVISPGTDLANALLGIDARGVVKRTIMTGGWVTTADGVKRSTYNMNMDLNSARVILSHLDVELVSSHLIKDTFGGGSLNAANAPGIAKILGQSEHPAFAEFRRAGLSWDEHLIRMIPPLAAIVGPYAARQFTPADVVAAALVVDPSLAPRAEAMKVDLTVDVDAAGALVELTPVERGPLTRVVAELDRARVLDAIEDVLSRLGCETALTKGF